MFLIQCFFFIVSFLCPPQYKTIKIHFKPVFGSENLVLDDKKYVTVHADTVSISTFRFYISQIQCVFDDGSTYDEPSSVHLLDAEKEESLSFDLKNVPDKPIRFVTYNIGVDSLANVSGALTGALDPISGMYWAWNTGYINAKIEGKSSSCKTKKNVFEFHIGGYLSPFCTVRKVKLPCVFPLTPRGGTVGTGEFVVEVDVNQWFTHIKLVETNSVLLPNKTAMMVADNYAQMFRMVNE